jgi:lysophospholipase L1-like esterase
MDMAKKGKKIKNIFKYFCILFFGIFIGVALLESGARIIWKHKYNSWLEKQLNGYDHLDYRRSLIIPNPNTTVSQQQLKDMLLKHGKSLGLKSLETTAPAESISESDILFTINKYGYKGPEIDIPKPKDIIRILALGDSCTWGPYNDYYSYPRALERDLNKSLVNTRIEVVNAGVPGYNNERVTKRIDEFMSVEPNLVTIYLGWNQTIGRADIKKNGFLYRKLAVYRMFYHFFINRNDTGLQEDYQNETYYNEKDAFLNAYETYNFKYDISDLDILIKAIKRRNGNNIKIKIITLAGLFDLRIKPSAEILKKAFPTSSSKNLYLWPLLTKRYNEALRVFSKINDIEILDFEEIALNKFIPREQYFDDSVHLSIKGNLEMANILANELKRSILK